LEDGFGTDPWPQKLVEAGFSVRCFAHHFNKEGRKLDGVKDPTIIRFCDEHSFVLVTLDKAMRFTQIEAIKRTTIGIIPTESNDVGLCPWIDALITAKPQIERLWKKHPWPWFAHLSQDGRVRKVEHITKEMASRRRRPREQDEEEGAE
jgi:hypothetical protein